LRWRCTPARTPTLPRQNYSHENVSRHRRSTILGHHNRFRELALADSRSNSASPHLRMVVGFSRRRDSNAVFARAVSAGARWRFAGGSFESLRTLNGAAEH
jgi:hypothetical protein